LIHQLISPTKAETADNFKKKDRLKPEQASSDQQHMAFNSQNEQIPALGQTSSSSLSGKGLTY
jgi:hypothetical protein